MRKGGEEVYYIACAELYEVKFFDGKVATEDGAIGWLGWSDEGGGWPSVVRGKGAAKHFDEPVTPETAARWDGMPWWFRLKPGTLKNFRVVERWTREHEEEPA